MRRKITEEERAERKRRREERFQVPQEDCMADPIPWKEMSPEEFVARQWHLVGACSLHRYTYKNPELHKWMKRFGEIIEDHKTIEEVRKSILSEDEYRKVQEAISDIMKHGL